MVSHEIWCILSEKHLQCRVHLVRCSDMRRHRAQHCCRAPSWRTGPDWWCARRSGGGIQPGGCNRPRRRRWWACGSRSGCRLSATLPSLRPCNLRSCLRLCTCDAKITCNRCLRRLQISAPRGQTFGSSMAAHCARRVATTKVAGIRSSPLVGWQAWIVSLVTTGLACCAELTYR
jgi:hypothetical protein